MSVDIRIPAGSHGLEGTDETGVLIQEVTGHLIVVPHVDGVDEYVDAVSGSEGSHADISIGPRKPVVGRFAAVTLNGKVLGIRTTIVPASGHVPPAVDRYTCLVVVMAEAETRLKVAVDLDGREAPSGSAI